MDQLSACKLLPRVVSWASDGAKTELSLQKLLLGDYPVLELKIPSQHSHFSTINIQRSLTPGGKPISYLVDEKHTLKNARNAHSSGARLLTTGNGVLLHRDLVDIVARDNSPLLQRDVHRRDHQDDQGAARYASVALLQHVAEETPSHSTLLVYLYIFGELHSAIQSRSLPHLHRLRILLTVRYYLEGWRTFISAHPDYPPHRSFLSSEFITIVFRLIDGYIGLTHTFRDEFPDRPFFPWRHSTEMLEHLFASARTLAPDFDALGFVQAANKLATLMELDIQLDAQSAGLPLPTSSSAKGRAAEGYHHTYNRMDGVDLVNLSTYFTDADLRLAVAEVSLCLSFLRILVRRAVRADPTLLLRRLPRTLLLYSRRSRCTPIPLPTSPSSPTTQQTLPPPPGPSPNPTRTTRRRWIWTSSPSTQPRQRERSCQRFLSCYRPTTRSSRLCSRSASTRPRSLSRRWKWSGRSRCESAEQGWG